MELEQAPGDLADGERLGAVVAVRRTEPRPEPDAVVPGFLRLLDERPPGGRYAASELVGGRR